MQLRSKKTPCAPILLTVALILAAPLPASASRADSYFKEAQEYVADGEIKAAVIQLKNALKADPTHIRARLGLGALQLQLGDGAAAEKEFGRARDLGAAKSKWMLGFVKALQLQNDQQRIVDVVELDGTLSPEDQAELLGLRGAAQLSLGNVDAAAADFDVAVKKDPGSPTANLGKAQILLGQKRLDEALYQLDQVLLANPDHYATLIARGNLLRAMLKFDRAAADFAAAAAVAPNDPRAHVGAAFVYTAQRKLPEAKASLARLRAVSSGLPILHYLQALVSYQEQDYGRASDELQVFLRAMPSSLQGQILYGVVSYARGEFTIADDYLTRVLASAPRNLELIKLLAATRLKLKQPDRAVEVLAPVVNAQTGDAQLLALLGTAYLQDGNNTKGAEYIERAVRIDPDQALLRTQLAVGKLAAGDTSGAISELQSAVALDQDVIQADVLLVLGYLNKGDYRNALDAAAALEQRMPDSPIPLNLTGLAYLSQRNYEEARSRFNLALAKDPGFLVARMNLARVAMLTGQTDEAEAAYSAVLQSDPGHMGAMLGMSSLAKALGDHQASQRWLEQAHDANPAALQPVMILSEGYLRANEPLKANSVLSGLPPEQAGLPAVLRLKGMAQLQSGDYGNAVFTLRRLTETEPESIEGWFQLARAYAASGDSTGARESFRRAIALDRNHVVPTVWIGLGELELREKDFEAALEVGKQMTVHFPDNVIAHDIEATAYRGLGLMDAALESSKRALELHRDSRRINSYAGQLTRLGKVPEAIGVLEGWLDSSPEDVSSWSRLGMLNQHVGNIDAALTAYERAASLSSDDPVLLNNMAWLYLGRDDQRAIDLATRAYRMAPSRAEIVDTYGWVLLQSGRPRDGLAALQQALLIAPRNAEIALHVAEGLRQLGRGEEARPILQRVMRENPNTDFADSAREMLNKLSG
jgi:putative PEP-CTERM system TPR-repeat lipoprotein